MTDKYNYIRKYNYTSNGMKIPPRTNACRWNEPFKHFSEQTLRQVSAAGRLDRMSVSATFPVYIGYFKNTTIP